MKRMIASAGLVALGAVGVQAAAYTPGFASVDMSKPWSVSATLRGFYDDNYAYAASGSPAKRDSFGFEVRPSASVSFSTGQTDGGLRYTYSMRYYADREENSADHSHDFLAVLNHSFSERYRLSVSDSFVIAQEAELLSPAPPYVPMRTKGNNIRNLGTASFQAQLTTLLGVEVRYANTFYDYENSGGNALNPSRSGLLDRMEHLAALDLRWQVMSQTVGILGYQYGQVDYTGDEEIAFLLGSPVTSKVRNARSHYGYVGAEHNFSPDLTGAIRGGVQYADYYNAPEDDAVLAPYALANLRYLYAPGSSLEVGVQHSRNATDVIGTSGSSVTTDAESSVVYASINHRITPQVTGNLLAQYQHSELNGGLYDGQSDDFYLVGLNLGYRLNPHLSAEVGYNFDRLDSDVPGRNFTRNRVYVGVTGSY